MLVEYLSKLGGGLQPIKHYVSHCKHYILYTPGLEKNKKEIKYFFLLMIKEKRYSKLILYLSL